jgi:hypothetical protein
LNPEALSTTVFGLEYPPDLDELKSKFRILTSTTVLFLLLSYGRMLWGGEEDGSKGVFLQERVPSGGRM